MASEVEFWSGRSIPGDYAPFLPGDAAFTQYIKDHSDIVYVKKRVNRRGYTQIVAYYAPANVIQEAQEHLCRLRQRKDERAERQRRGVLIGAAADRTVEALLGLSSDNAREVVRHYKKVYGKKKGEYLRRAMTEWRTGQRGTSGLMRERLLEFLPPFLSLELRYEIIKQLYRNCLVPTSIQVVIYSQKDIDAVHETARRHLGKPEAAIVPSMVHDVARWLTDGDSQLCLELIDRLRREEEPLLYESLHAQLLTLSEFVSRIGGHSSAVKVIELPTLTITVTIWRGVAMDSTSDDKRQLAVPEQNAVVRQVPASASSFLDGAIRNADPETIKQLTEIAAKEAIKIAVKEKEVEIHGQSTQNKLDQAVTTARQLSSIGENFALESEDRSSTGYTRVTVTKNDPPKPNHPPKPEVKASCFVATVCYGDPDHPTVIELRNSETPLARHRPGRCFIEWYYAYGPRMALFVEDHAFVKKPLRASFRLLAWFVAPSRKED